MKKKLIIIIPGLVLIGLILLISWKFVPKITKPSYKIDEFKIIKLNDNEKPFVWDTVTSLQPDFPTDKDGVILYLDKYYHPVQIANTGLVYLDSFQKTNNQEYLQRAEKYANKLKEISIVHDGAIYFPYTNDFALHDLDNDIMKAPWYSGMAQGEALSLFTRLDEITNNKEYLKTAQKIFKSFTNYRGSHNPWTVLIDKDGYYWIEEFPKDESDDTLNGFIYGLYGVYDYYELTKSDEARKVFQGSLTTLKHYLPEFRNPGGISYYCLKHKKQNADYHKKHIIQLNMLYSMTGDEYFKQMADNFYADYH